MRMPKKKDEETQEAEAPAVSPNTKVVEREINLALINDKLNYLITLSTKIAEACEIDLSKL